MMAAAIHAVSPCDAVMYVKSHSPAANTAAIATITPGTTQFVVVWSVTAGYDTSPTITKASMTTTGLAGDQLNFDVIGTMPFQFGGPVHGTIGTAVVCTLAADDGGAIGNINVVYSLHQGGA